MSGSTIEPGSFRDADGRVFYRDGDVFRALSEQGLADWEALASTRFFATLVEAGKIVDTAPTPSAVPTPPELGDGWAAVLRHEAVPFVSYPYEWPFGMLKDAALLHLELLLAALDEDLILKDASPYNVQWRGSRPVFIDVGSFERLRGGEPWAGYRQFCMLLLYPLMLQAYKEVPFQPWLRGSLEGITPEECRNLMSARDRFRRGVLAHVHLHSRLERRYGDRRRDVRSELARAGFDRELIRANAKRLQRLVRRLEWAPSGSQWSGYGPETSYDAADAERKAAFVREAAASRRWELVWDVGCNDGRYSRLAAEQARYVVAMDADHAVVEGLYDALSRDRDESILPLVVNVGDPSPALGWRGRERTDLEARGRPELVLCLALVHHLAITQNVSVRELVDWLAALGASVVIEFVTKEDPMAERLLSAKRAGSHADYEQDVFERCLTGRFDVQRSESLASGARTLYSARPKA